LLALAGWAFCGELEAREPGGGIAVLLRGDLAPGLAVKHRVVHDYGDFVLLRLSSVDGVGTAGVHVLSSAETVSFRGWSGRVAGGSEVSGLPEALYILDLVGPLDRRWRDMLDAAGVEILAPAHPHALVVGADGAGLARALELRTSRRFPVVRGVRPLPVEARLHRSLFPVSAGGGLPAELEVVAWNQRRLESAVKRDDVLAVGGLVGLLGHHPEIAYVEPVFEIELHNNLAAGTGQMAVEALWTLGYLGAGVAILHNDSGVDLHHPDLEPGITASVGKMAYTDTAHGTHTAGSIVGRGLAAAPENTSGCGDLTAGLPTARGMAPAAALITNNIFEGGFDDVSAMMAWGAGRGAVLSSNSWGLLGQAGPEVGYSLAAARADGAVRDADPDKPGAQPLSIFFSAGNTGPDPGTVTSPGTAKNVVTVGALQNARCGAWVPSHQAGPDVDAVLSSSGRGPSQGRIKPDLAAPGSDVLSLQSADAYAVQLWDQGWSGPELALNTGTSQACALAAGSGALAYEFLWRTRGRAPSPALLKAALIAGAEPSIDGSRDDRGWGRLDLESSVAGPGFVLDQNETAELATGEVWSGEVVVGASSPPLTVAVVWTDPPGEEDADNPLVNDLDLVATSPSGVVFKGNVTDGPWSRPWPGLSRDDRNNVEVIRVEEPETGGWTLDVVGVNVAWNPDGLAGQDFAVVVSGDAQPCADPPPPPAAVAADAVGDNAVRVSWTAVVGAGAYEVSRSRTPGGRPYEPVAVVDGSATWFTDVDVSGGIDYHYVVRAERGCWSAFSEEASVTATGECRLAPVFAGLGEIDTPAAAGCSLIPTWEAAVPQCGGPVVYDVYRGETPDFEPGSPTLVAEAVAATSLTDVGLDGDSEHFYLVRARHTGWDADDGNTVILGARPAPAEDLFFFSGAEDGIDEWVREPGSDADGGGSGWTVVANDSWSGDRAWFVADEDGVKDQILMTAEPVLLPAGTAPRLEFHHRQRLQRGRDGGRLEISTNGGLDWFDILSGDGQTVPPDPGRWVAGGYNGVIGGAGNPLYGDDGWTGDSAGWVHSAADLEAFAGQRVMLRWRFGGDETAGNGGGWWLDEIRLALNHPCQPCVPTGPPTGLIARTSSDGVEIEWNAVPGVSSYQVWRKASTDGPYVELATVEGSAVAYHDVSASGGSIQTYAVTAQTAVCRSERSSPVTATAGGPCEGAPLFWGLDGVEDRRKAECSLDLFWREAIAGCEGAGVRYRVYASASAGFEPDPDTLLADNVAGPRFRDITIADAELRHYLVRAVDGVSGAEESNRVTHEAWTTGPRVVHFSDGIEDGTGQWWTGVGSDLDSGTEPWSVAEDTAHTGLRSWFCAAEPRVKDQVVGLVDAMDITDESMVLVFHHRVELEPFWDGGRLEYSTDGGVTWWDILQADGDGVPANSERIVWGAYSGVVGSGTDHPFAGERAWTGSSGGWTESRVELGDLLGRSVAFRWRLGCDRSEAWVGWWLDDVELCSTSSCETITLPEPRLGGRRVQ
jgi:hypothetical protein